MLGNPEGYDHLSQYSLQTIHHQMCAAAATMFRKADKQGRQGYYEATYRITPTGLRKVIRDIASAAFPNTEDRAALSNDAVAVEQGLVVGTQFAKHSLSRGNFKRYAERLEADLAWFRSQGYGPYDLEHMLQQRGEAVTERMRSLLRPAVLAFESADSVWNERRNGLYGNALGYSAAAAETMLIETRLAGEHLTDRAAVSSIKSDIRALGGIAAADISAHFPPPTEQ